MKNRKVIVTAFLLVAIMILGVGYAAITDTLNIHGNATVTGDQVVEEYDLDIRIVAVAEDNPTGWIDYSGSADTQEINRANDLIVNISGTGDDVQDTANFQIFNLSNAGDEQVIWFKITNTSNANDATLAVTGGETADANNLFSFAYQIYETDGTTTTTALPANGEVWVKVTVTLDTDPSAASTAAFSISIVATTGT